MKNTVIRNALSLVGPSKSVLVYTAPQLRKEQWLGLTRYAGIAPNIVLQSVLLSNISKYLSLFYFFQLGNTEILFSHNSISYFQYYLN